LGKKGERERGEKERKTERDVCKKEERERKRYIESKFLFLLLECERERQISCFSHRKKEELIFFE